ncbi:MAG TPA: response regulator [Chitinophagaceae bacterium]|nr:response regulator [Chitinophagaceae bacterium]
MRKNVLSFLSRACRLILALQVAGWIPARTAAQASPEEGFVFIRNYTSKDTKTHPQVFGIQQDNSGVMYFGVNEGVMTYDGVHWKTLPVDGSRTFLATVRDMDKDSNGVVYFGSFGNLGYIGHDSLGRAATRSLLPSIPREYRKFTDIWSTRATPQGVYFQSREYLFRLADPVNPDSAKRGLKVWKPTTRFMFGFYVDGQYYIHQSDLGLFRMVGDSLVLIPGSEFLGKDRMRVMLPYPADAAGNKRYLVGGFHTGLYIFDGKTFQPLASPVNDIFRSGFILYNGLRLQDGNYLLSAIGRGLFIIDPSGRLVQVINRISGLQDESAYVLLLEKSGNLWLGLDAGISRVQISYPLTHFTIQSGINSNSLVFCRFAGSLYLGTSNGLMRFDTTRKLFQFVPDIPRNQVFNLLPHGDELLVPSDGLYAVRQGRVVPVYPGGNLGLTSLLVSRQHPNLLLAGGSVGLAVFYRKPLAPGSSRWTEWQYAGTIPGIIEHAWFLAEDPDGSFWTGTQGQVAYHFSVPWDASGAPDLRHIQPEAKTFPHFLGALFNVGTKTYFAGDTILFTYDARRNSFVPDPVFGGFHLGAEDLLDIETGPDSTVWIRLGKNTRKAILRPDGTYQVTDAGLNMLDDYAVSGVYPDKNGIVWFCGAEGLIRYDSRKPFLGGQTFRTLLTQVYAGREGMNLLDGSRDHPSPVHYSRNTLRFEYAAPFFDQEDKTRYQTWLEGFDKDWSPLDYNYYKEYTNLPPGTYTFHVRATNIFGHQGTEAVYSFEIFPPWYRTWWAYLLYALAAVLLLYWFVRSRTRKLQERHRELEKVVTDRTRELSQRVEELGAINKIQEGLVRELDSQGIFDLVGDRLCELFPATQTLVIRTFDHATGLEHWRYSREKGVRQQVEPRPFNWNSRQLIATRQPLDIESNYIETAKKYGGRGVTTGQPPRSAIFVPMVLGDQVKGSISLQNVDQEHAFTSSDIRLLTTVANSMTVALENAQLFEEVKQARMEAEASGKAAERANQAKSAFLSTVSHELRTPLTSVLGFAKIIKKRLEDRIFPVTDKSDPRTERAIQQVSENLDVVVSEGERLTHLINDVLDLAKIEAGKMEWNMETVSMADVADRAIAATTALFENKPLVLDKQIEAGLPEITGDRDKLIQVMVNLISNAVKFTPQGTITCRVMRQQDEIVVSVTDSGIGIAPEDHAAVFEQFKQVGDTLTDKPKGTGLGLPICKEIVEHHGGRIWVDSALGKGSTFYFALPVSKGSAPKPIHLDDLVRRLKQQVVQSQLQHQGPEARLLIVDDDDSIRSLLQQELSDAGYRIEEASNGKEALAKVRANKPDLIILDIMMPEMNGFDVAAVLKNDPQTMDIPIIVLSIVQDKARGFRIGVDRYLTKPIDTDLLFNEIGSLLEQGKSRKKVLVVDEDTGTVNTLTEVLKAKGYVVTESNGRELVQKAVASQPDIIIINSVLSGKQDIVQTLRFEKGLENVLFLVYQ